MIHVLCIYNVVLMTDDMYSFLLGFFLLLFDLIDIAVANTASEETQVLQQLYIATHGESWTWDIGKTPWTFDDTSDPCIDRWDGVLCDFSANQCKTRVCHITELELRTHNLTGGPLPCLSNLSSLVKFSVSANNLTGTIDDFVFDTLPLSSLSLSYNAFTGTLPSSITSLFHLSLLDITECSFSGSIPLSLFLLSKLKFLYLNSNELTGTLPEANLPVLSVLALSTNRFHGAVPLSLFSSTDMLRITLSHNKFTGPLPSSIGTCSQLVLLYLSKNSFSNTIPSSICLLSQLWALSLYGNMLSGTIPSCLGNFHALQDLSLFSNPLTGTLPSSLGNLDRRMETLNIYDTHLHGQIPLSIGNMTSLAQLYLQDNLHTGSMPSTMSSLANMQYLSLNGNHLTGRIPAGIWKFTFLLELWLHDNRLSGSLPDNMLATAVNLRVLLLQNNRFAHSIQHVFDQASNSTLRNIDISGNLFTGSLPHLLFALPQLRTVSAGNNCFGGSLPSSICNATWLNTIALDGLGRNNNCETSNFLAHPYRYVKNVFFHTISSNGVMDCVFLIPGLETLHLSGNGIHASLPYNIVPADSLRNVLLTHNRLYGSISHRLVSQPFDEMDLSNNRFGGTLPSSVTNASLEYHFDAAVNRLSGFIPSHIRKAEDVNILVGNNFDCDSKHPKPEHDPHENDVVCGSDRYEIALIIFACCCAVLCLVILAIGLIYTKRSTESCPVIYRMLGLALHMLRYTRNMSLEMHSQLKTDYLYFFLDMIYTMRKLCVICGAYFVLAVSTLVLGLKLSTHTYSTHEEQYAFLLSTSYLSGVIPASLLLAIWFCGVVGVIYYTYCRIHCEKVANLQAAHHAASKTDVAPDVTNKYYKSTSAIKITLTSWLVVLINCAVILVADGVYVYATLSADTTKTQKESAQFIIAGFKLLWNFVMIPVLIKYIPAWSLKAVDKAEVRLRINHRVHYKSCILIFNNIIAPLLATLFSDYNCFRELFETHDPVDASYYFVTCIYALVSAARGEYICTEYGQIGPFVTTYVPSWQYNYQCGFAVLSNYIPVYVYIYASLLIIQPLVYAVVVYTSSIFSQSSRYRNLVPTLFWHHSTKYNRTLLEGLLSSMINHVTVLFTFGLMCPPLAVAILCVVFLQTNLFAVLVGRYVEFVNSVHHQQAEECETNICVMLMRERKSLSYIIFWPMDSCCLVVYVSAVFCGLIVFDIAGDAIGGILACIFIMFIFVLVLISVRALKIIKRWQASNHRNFRIALVEPFQCKTDSLSHVTKDVENGIVLNVLNSSGTAKENG